jgi:hypothetical protein
VDVFAALTGFIPLSLALSREGRGKTWIKTGNKPTAGFSTTWREAFNAFEMYFPSPLAGEGQGEGV